MARTKRRSRPANEPARMKRLAATVLCAMMALAAHADEQDSDGVVVITGDTPAGTETRPDSGVVVTGGDDTPDSGQTDPGSPRQGPDARNGVSQPGTTAAADKVTAPAPADEATVVQPDTYLEWAPAAGATGYLVYLGTDPIPDDGEYAGETADAWYGPTTLDFSTTYYWRVDAKNAAGAVTTGDVWFFATTPPSPCQVRGGIPVPGLQIDVLENVRLLWPEACHAAGYHLYFGTNPTPGAQEYHGLVAETTYEVGTLEPDSTYYWRVDAMNEAEVTRGEVWSFSTPTPLPEAVTDPSPAHRAGDVPVDTTLSWNSSKWAKFYRVKLVQVWVGPILEIETTETAYDPGPLDFDTEYHWWVYAVNEAGVTESDERTSAGGYWLFRTGDDPAPAKVTGGWPRDGTRGVHPNVELSWEEAEWAADYLVYFGTDPEPDRNPGPFNEYRGATEGLSYSTGRLAEGTTYYWRIDSRNGGGNVTTGDVWEFTTESEAREPDEEPSPETFRDCEWCPSLVVVPAGSFTMGSPASEQGRGDDEGPRHRVTIREPFALGVYEVTRGEFAHFVASTGHETGDSCVTYESGGWKYRDGRNWRNPGHRQTDRHPVVCVNWYDAQAYLRWLSRETGHEYRLPSESEWEYAARAETTTARYWGESAEEQCRHGNGADRAIRFDWAVSCDDGHARSAPAGAYTRNGHGLYDMLGNAWEWTQDCWQDSYRGAPVDGATWEHGECGRRVLRGGSWGLPERHLRSASRGWGDAEIRDDFIGFRVARTLTS